MKLKLLTSILAAGAMLAATSAFALSDAQKAAINTKVNAATTASLATDAAQALKDNCPDADNECLQFLIGAAKAKLGPNASIASVRNLVNALVLAAPTRAAAIVSNAGAAFPGMKANIASAAQAGLATAASNGQITPTQANALSGQVNAAAGISGGGSAVPTGRTEFQWEQARAAAAARVEFQRSNQNNYQAPQ